MPLSRILTNIFSDKANNIVSVGTNTPKANIGGSNTGNSIFRLSSSGNQAFIANNGNSVVSMLSSNTGIGTSLLSISDYTGYTGNVIISFARSKISSGNASTRFGPNYAMSDTSGTDEYAVRAELYAPVIEMNADSGKISLWSDSTTGSGLYRTPTRREALTANYLGQVIKPNNPSFYAYVGGSNPSYIAGNVTMPYNVVSYDLGVSTCYNTSTYRFTAPIAGTYLFTANVNMYSGPGVWMIAFWVNNSTAYNGNRLTASVSGDNNINHALVIKLALNDFIEVRMSVANGGQFSSGVSYNWFSGTFIG
jgi:hypothetical protein